MNFLPIKAQTLPSSLSNAPPGSVKGDAGREGQRGKEEIFTHPNSGPVFAPCRLRRQRCKSLFSSLCSCFVPGPGHKLGLLHRPVFLNVACPSSTARAL